MNFQYDDDFDFQNQQVGGANSYIEFVKMHSSKDTGKCQICGVKHKRADLVAMYRAAKAAGTAPATIPVFGPRRKRGTSPAFLRRQALGLTGKKRASPKKPSSRKGTTMPKLDKALYTCAGLSQERCEVAPNCNWKPKAKVCSTAYGAKKVAMFKGPERQNMLSMIRNLGNVE